MTGKHVDRSGNPLHTNLCTGLPRHSSLDEATRLGQLAMTTPQEERKPYYLTDVEYRTMREAVEQVQRLGPLVKAVRVHAAARRAAVHEQEYIVTLNALGRAAADLEVK